MKANLFNNRLVLTFSNLVLTQLLSGHFPAYKIVTKIKINDLKKKRLQKIFPILMEFIYFCLQKDYLRTINQIIIV